MLSQCSSGFISRSWRFAACALGFAVFGGCVGECEGINQPDDDASFSEFAVLARGTGSGTVRHTRVPPASGFHFDCRIARAQTSGQCVQTGVVGDGDIVVLEITPANSQVTALGGACVETSGTRCTIQHTVNGIYAAIFDLDTLGAPQSLVYFDDFSTPMTWNTTLLSSNGASTHSAALSVPGGGPDSYRRMDHTLPPSSSIVVFHGFGGATYDPRTQGAITSLSYSESRIVSLPPFPGAAVGSAFALEQSGQVFTAGSAAFSNTNWSPWSLSGIVAADFAPAPGPDFSASGSPITFGYSRSNTNNGDNASSRTHGIDNWRVEVFR